MQVRRLPTQLCVFGAVEDLCLDHAMDLQREGDGGMQPIRHLTRVTHLSMQVRAPAYLWPSWADAAVCFGGCCCCCY